MWSSLDKNARLGMIAVITILVILTLVVLVWVFSHSNSNLFSNLDEKEASNVIFALEEMKIPYELSKGGKDISVDNSVVEQVRLKLIGKGVRIQSGDGFELFDDANIGMTEYSQKINYLRAMQGELARSIMSIDGIKYARVHLVLPETSIFKQNKQTPTASVTVIPEADVTLSSGQITGIQRMLAAATPGITQDNVTVQDNHGITLSETEHESDKEQITSMLLKKKREVELYMEAKVNTILNRAFGKGKSVTAISVDLVIDKIHRKEEIVLPQKSKSDGILRKRESNAGEKKENTKNNNKSVEIEYQLSKRIEEIISMPGAIARISIGIIVPENTSSEKIINLRDVIAMAVGLDTRRGDGIGIYPMKMNLLDKKFKSNVTSFLAHPSKEKEKDSIKNDENPVETIQNLEKVISYNQLVYIAAGFILFALILLIRSFIISRNKTTTAQRDLSIQEKEKLLSDLKLWIKEGAA